MLENPSPTRMAATSSSTSSCFMNSSAQRLLLGLALLLGRLLAHDVEPPAGQLARSRMFWPAAADRLRELLLRDCDVHAVRVLVHDDRAHLGGRHGVDHELRRILVERDDVHALAGDLVRHGLHARTAHADARSTGSMRGSLLRTAILARAPGSRAAPRMLISPATSGTSSLNSSMRNSGRWAQNSCGPRGSGRTSSGRP